MDQGQEVPAPLIDHEPLEFTAARWPLTKLLIVNTLLTILTVGIYRFWAKTKVRRYLWWNVEFLGDPLEYTGSGKELFLGFLIVIAVLFPLGLIYNTISFLVPLEMVWLRVLLEVAYFAVLYALIQIAVYRAWRYRMSRTAWRGIRFGLDGSTTTYLKIALGWSFLTLITLGLAYPWMQIDLWRYQIQHTRIGTERFKFEGDAKGLLTPWLCTLVPGLIWLATNIYIIASVLPEFGGNPDAVVENEDARNWFLVMVFASGPCVMLATIFYFWFSVRLTRKRISGLEIGTTAFYSALPFGRLFGFATIAVIVNGIVTGAFAALLIFAGLSQLPAFGGDQDPTQIGQFIGFAIAIIGFMIIFPFFWTIIFKFEVLKQMVQTTEIINPHALQYAAQSAKEGPGTGEGLADALDVGGL